MTTTTTHPVIDALTHLDEWTARFYAEMHRTAHPKVPVGHDLSRVRSQLVEDGAAASEHKARVMIADAEAAGLVVLYGEGQARKVAEVSRFDSARALLRYNAERRQRAIDGLLAKAKVSGGVAASWGGGDITLTVEVAEVLAGLMTPPLPDNVDPEVSLELMGVPSK